MSERAWRDGDIVIDSDGNEWHVWLTHTAGWCLVESYGVTNCDLIENLLARGWRLKETSMSEPTSDAQTIEDLRAEIARQAETIRQLRAELEGRAKGTEQ